MNKFQTLEQAYNESADFPIHLRGIVKDILFKAYNETAAVYPEIVAQEDSNSEFEEYSGIYGNLELLPTGPLEPFKDAGIKEAGLKVPNHKYGRTISWPYEFIEDGKAKVFPDVSKKYGIGFKRTVDRAVLDVLTNTSNYSTSYNNLITDNINFSYEGVREGYNLFTTMRGPDGVETNVYPDTILIHPLRMWEVPEIFANTRVLTEGITDSDTVTTSGSLSVTNLLTGRFKILMSPYVPSPDHWYLFKSKEGLVLQNRAPLSIVSTSVVSHMMMDKEAFTIKARTRFGVGMIDRTFHVSNKGS